MLGALTVSAALVIAPAGAAPPASDGSFHPGIGYLVSHATTPAAGEVGVTAPRATPPPPSALAIAPLGRPPTVLERLQTSRRGEAFQIGAAIAVQAGMIIYGVASLLAQRGEADRESERLYGDIPKWDPYPR